MDKIRLKRFKSSPDSGKFFLRIGIAKTAHRIVIEIWVISK